MTHFLKEKLWAMRRTPELFSQLECLDHFVVFVDVVLFDIVEHATALRNELDETHTAGEILFVGLQVVS